MSLGKPRPARGNCIAVRKYLAKITDVVDEGAHYALHSRGGLARSYRFTRTWLTEPSSNSSSAGMSSGVPDQIDGGPRDDDGVWTQASWPPRGRLERWIVSYAVLTWCASVFTPFLRGRRYAVNYEDSISEHNSMRRTSHSLETTGPRERTESRPRKSSRRERRVESGY